MKALIRKLVESWGKPNLSSKGEPLLDLAFYRRRYPDVRTLVSDKSLIAHYRTCGIAEGRFPNAEMELETLLRDGIGDNDPFDLVAYRTLNPDLNRTLRGDAEFVAHYIDHGRAEKRPCSFPDQDAGVLWRRLFNPSQYLAWCPDTFETAPIDFNQAFNHFCKYGLDRLAPLNFDDWFDPAFYRCHYGIAPAVTDAELYREWLDKGLAEGRSPNEFRLLESMLRGRAFPVQLEWRAYCAEAELDPAAGRSAALVWMFEVDEDAERIVRFARPCGITLFVDICHFRYNRGDHYGCFALFREWGESDKDCWPPELWGLASDVSRYLGDLGKAWVAALAAIGDVGPDFSALERVVDIAGQRAKPIEALEALEGQAVHWHGDPRFSALCMSVLERLFEQESARAHAVLRSEGEPGEADGILTNCVERGWLALDRLMLAPARLGPVADGHIPMLANLDLRQCNHYRVEQKAEWLAAEGLELRVHSEDQPEAFIKDLVGARAVIFYRVQATPGVLKAIFYARAMGIPTYYEIDDLIFDADAFPPPLQSYAGTLSAEDYRGLRFAVPLFRSALSACDRAIASTDTLLKSMLPLVREHTGVVLRNGIDSRNQAARFEKAAAKRSAIRIFYGSGTKAHGQDFAEIAGPALSRIMENFAGVELVLVGNVPIPDCLKAFRSRIIAMTAIPKVHDYWAVLAQCDINLAVLRRGGAEDAKSEIKWLEAAVQGVPSVVSATPSYQEVLRDGEDVFLAATTDEWYQSLARLVADREKRELIGQCARATALAKFSREAAIADFRAAFGLSAPDGTPAGQHRVLICNVFFPPQLLGGATRVVAANVEYIARNCPDVAQAVFTCDAWPSDDTHLSTSDYEGTPVFRLSLPQDANEDDAQTRASIVDGFRQVIRVFRPHMVHFHCIQRLSDVIVSEVLNAGIPYIVTLHDGWWISPHQFLVDQYGFERCGEIDPLADRGLPADEAGKMIARRARHYPLLEGAAHRLAVSDAFAQVYKAAGIEGIATLANGMPTLKPAQETHQGQAALRVAHIGGRMVHKGADLVEASLRLGQYGTIEFVMIDGSVPAGRPVETVWGSTRVQLIAPVQAEDITELYNSVDVILVPSIWPESYGLVVREALHCGNWVVVSDVGALAEAVVDGVNGTVLPSRDRGALDRLFADMQMRPEQYRRDHKRSLQTKRTLDDQSAELAEIYRRLSN